ncbi:MAG: hypothetical protein UT24_C0020G0006 [Candidatus Woesebacteria bacterium GW2011_GWB1_39_12]|uniref:Uncharacterized protein n=1 Tax=Candidatus Woesebacteria bacterium GW2011_GWB1_39_12 TaxID=1618574 RepID=A0A0G0M715_9BACT|nr:MAG: hypothetical protein UT24_C0020G0006 [Candidatus Woesebacteria bacterium GW2011_GWB1_39_12]
MAELNVATLSDLVRLAPMLWEIGKDSVQQTMRTSGLVKEIPIPANSGNTREFSEIDLQEYAKTKNPGDQAERAAVQQGLTLLALVKSFLINGENLKAFA